jgi:hypothetical protein
MTFIQFFSQFRQIPVGQTPNFECLISLINTLANIARSMSSTRNTENFMQTAILLITQSFLNMSQSELRTVSTDILDVALTAFDTMNFDFYGYNQLAGQQVEKFRLDLGLLYLNCPFLNRRLFGLKLINDLLKRAMNQKACPSSIYKVVTENKANNAVVSNASVTPVIGPALPPSTPTVVYSYQYFPITHDYTLRVICEVLLAQNLLATLYEGNDIHESIVARSSQILISFANENLLADDQLERLLKIGLSSQVDLLKVIPEIIPHLSSVKNRFILEFLRRSIVASSGQVNAAQAGERFSLTEAVVAIVCTIAAKTRDILMLNYRSGASRSIPDPMLEQGTFEHEIFIVHDESLKLLLDWAKTDSTHLELITDKIESILEYGIPLTEANERKHFPFHRQYLRFQSILKLSLQWLQPKDENGHNDYHDGCSYNYILPACKILQGLLYAIPANFSADSAWNFELDEIGEEIEEISVEQRIAIEILGFKPVRDEFTKFLVEREQI